MARLNELDRRAIAAFATAGPSTRAHVLLRAATCPLAELDALVPRSGRVLDVGCGHGLGSVRMALAAPSRCVVGVDIDADKLEVARVAAANAGVADRVTFELVEDRWRPGVRSVQAVVCVDVMYLLPPERRQQLLHACGEAIDTGGTVVLKEMAQRPLAKAWLAFVQEMVSVRLLGITRGDGVHPVDPDVIERVLLAQGLAVRRIDLSRARPHPHMALVARRGSDR